MSTVGLRVGLTALLVLASCTRVLGLRDDYFVDELGGGGAGGGSTAGSAGTAASGGVANSGGAGVPDGGGPGGTGGKGGTSGNIGSAGSAGSAGASDVPVCSDHPLTAKSTWVPSASNTHGGDPVSDVIDNTTARWSTGKPQSGDEWLQIDFGSTVTLRSINLQQGLATDSNDYPRMYAVCVSDVDRNLKGPEIASGVGTSGVSTTIVLSRPFSGRYLLIKQLGSSISWWSVEEIEVSCFDD